MQQFNRYLLLIFFLITSFPAFSQNPVYNWTKAGGGTMNDRGNGIAIDNSGNVIIVGAFEGTITVDTATLSTSRFNDMFITKRDSAGNSLWTLGSSGTSNFSSAEANAVATDAQGNIYVTGTISDQTTLDTLTINAVGAVGFFLAKFNPAGDILWIKSEGSSGFDSGRDVTVDGNGDVIVTGNFASNAVFGNDTLTGFGFADIFLAKYDNNGNLIWVEEYGGSDFDLGAGITADGTDLYLTGTFENTAYFGQDSVNSRGGSDLFVAKVDGSGNLDWVIRKGSTTNDESNSIDMDSNGDLVITGYYSGSINFGLTQLDTQDPRNIFIAKFDNQGNDVWATAPAATSSVGDNIGFAVSVDPTDDTYYISGRYGARVDFPAATLNNSAGFLAAYSATGTNLWAIEMGNLTVNDVVAGPGKNAYTCGNFDMTYDFGGTQLTSAGVSDFFFSRLDVNFVGREALNPVAGLHIYPNPARDYASIAYELGHPTTVEYTLTDLYGKVHQQEKWVQHPGNQQTQLNLRDLKPGLYFISLEADDLITTSKLLVTQ